MKRALDSVNERILAAVQRRKLDAKSNQTTSSQLPRLVAVSKLKPIASIIEAYQCGQRYFGENYIQELEEKSNSSELLQKCPDIKFHFIGHLQSNKVSKLLRVKNLHMVETIDSIKLADLIDKAIEKHLNDSDETHHQLGMKDQPLKVMIQINTSGEERKNGIQPEEAPLLAEHIVQRCKRLQLAGIMTIGRLDGWPQDEGPNKDFLRLYELRNMIANKLLLDSQSLELSMGMSGDFEEAIAMGSTNVRVGTIIFGERPQKQSQ